MRPCLRVAAMRAAGGYCSAYEPFEQRHETVCDKVLRDVQRSLNAGGSH
jgi:hypothetical protein